MMRRRPLEVWPAFADLMTVLAIVGSFTTLALSYEGESKEEVLARLRESEQQQRKLQERLDRERRERELSEQRWSQDRRQLQQQIREAARNEKMFQAIQEAQRFIDAISSRSGLTFGADQSLQFGDDLVSFELNGVEPIWKKDSRERLRRFCGAISGQLPNYGEDSQGMGRFIVQVEGHTDSLGCPGDPNCNWWISSGRAANFVALMRQPQYCPGGRNLILRPVGFADSRPMSPNLQPSRRITVRLVPDYERIIAQLH